MKVVKVDLINAEKVKKELIFSNYFDKDYQPLKGDGFIYFPVVESYSGETFDIKLEKASQRVTFIDLLKDKLSENEFEILKRSYDFVGDIAIVEIDEMLRSKEKLIGEAILQTNNSVKTVLRKKGAHEGVFRVQENVFLAGEDKRETVHVENGLKFKVDVDKVYFSPRLGNERLRIAEEVRGEERVLVMFSGCGVYPITISKISGAFCVGVEINPAGHEYALENAKLNKVDVEFYCGDAREVVPSLGNFDRVIMPLPKTAVEFLDVVKIVAKKGTKVHLYAFQTDSEIDEETIWSEIEKVFTAVKRLELVKCCQTGPRRYRVSVDFEIRKI